MTTSKICHTDIFLTLISTYSWLGLYFYFGKGIYSFYFYSWLIINVSNIHLVCYSYSCLNNKWASPDGLCMIYPFFFFGRFVSSSYTFRIILILFVLIFPSWVLNFIWFFWYEVLYARSFPIFASVSSPNLTLCSCLETLLYYLVGIHDYITLFFSL